MDDWVVVILWVLGFAIGGPLLILAVMGPPAVVAHGLVRLGMRAPGGLGRRVREWERREPGTLTGFLTCVQVLGLLVALWTGLLGRFLLFVSGG